MSTTRPSRDPLDITVALERTAAAGGSSSSSGLVALASRAARRRACSGSSSAPSSSRASSQLSLDLLHEVAAAVRRDRAASPTRSSAARSSSGMAMLMAVPIAVLVAIYMSEYAGPRGLARLPRSCSTCSTAIPAIVVGIFIFGLLVVGHGQSAIFGAFALAILMIPMVARATQEVLEIVPRSQREASLALGVNKWRTVWSIILPSAIGGILTGVVHRRRTCRRRDRAAPLHLLDRCQRDLGRRLARARRRCRSRSSRSPSRPTPPSRRSAGRRRSC